MSVRIKIPVSLRRFTDGIEYISTVSGRFSDISKDMKRSHPSLFEKITTSHGDLKGYVLIFQNGSDIKDVIKENTHIEDNKELKILLAISGG